MQLRSSAAPALSRKRKRTETAAVPQSQKRSKAKSTSERLALTRQNLQTYTEIVSPGMSFRSRGESSKSTRTSDVKFPQKLRENGVVCQRSTAQPPLDLEKIKERLDRKRDSTSPDTDDYKDYVYRVEYASNEATLKQNAVSMFFDKPARNADRPYLATADQEWSDVGDSRFTNGLSRPKPDYTESFAVDPFPTQALRDLGPSLQPSAHNFTMPRFAMELKAPNGHSAQAEAQAAYDGAVMVEAAMQQNAYLGKQAQYSITQAMTVTSTGRQVGIQAHHAVQTTASWDSHMYLVCDDRPFVSRSCFRDTYRHVRNAREWAKDTSEETLDDMRRQENPPPPIATPTSPPTLRTLRPYNTPVSEPSLTEQSQPKVDTNSKIKRRKTSK